MALSQAQSLSFESCVCLQGKRIEYETDFKCGPDTVFSCFLVDLFCQDHQLNTCKPWARWSRFVSFSFFFFSFWHDITDGYYRRAFSINTGMSFNQVILAWRIQCLPDTTSLGLCHIEQRHLFLSPFTLRELNAALMRSSAHLCGRGMWRKQRNQL